MSDILDCSTCAYTDTAVGCRPCNSCNGLHSHYKPMSAVVAELKAENKILRKKYMVHKPKPDCTTCIHADVSDKDEPCKSCNNQYSCYEPMDAAFASPETNNVQWIDVNDRLPEVEDIGNGLFSTVAVIICCPDRDDEQVLGAFYDKAANAFCTDEGLNYSGVTHWMPMPAVPTEGNDV